MTLSNHVSLTITQDTVGVSRAGFGVPLIISNKVGTGPLIGTYSTLTEVASAGYATTSPEYLSAQAALSQAPKPESLKIGRCPTLPTQVYTITPVAVNDGIYTITCAGEGVTTTSVSFTADATATVAEVTAGLLPLINGVVGKNFTAVDNTTHLTITGNAAGEWFALTVGSATLLGTEQSHVDPGVATDLNALVTESDDFYCVLSNFNSSAYVLAVAAWVESKKKIYVVDVQDSEAITTAAGNGDTLDALATLNRARTGGVYNNDTLSFNAAAWAGRCLPETPGAITWKFKSLSGVVATSLTSTQRGYLIARSANFMEDVAGLEMMSEGTTSDGDFLDSQRSDDWLDDDMRKTVFEHMAAGGKVPFTDGGVAIITSAVKASLQRGIARGVLAADPAPAVSAPKIATVSAADKLARTLPDVSFSATKAGAIHKTTMTGVVSA